VLRVSPSSIVVDQLSTANKFIGQQPAVVNNDVEKKVFVVSSVNEHQLPPLNNIVGAVSTTTSCPDSRKCDDDVVVVEENDDSRSK
jgi:hypothetical protein